MTIHTKYLGIIYFSNKSPVMDRLKRFKVIAELEDKIRNASHTAM